MHSATQILAQRAPPATRAKGRWQPYNSTPAAISILPSRSPTTAYLNTPSSSVPSPFQTVNSSCDINRPRQPLPTTTGAIFTLQTPKEPIQRDTSKHKFAVGLIDQTVKTLSEIWRPQDIPRIFVAPSKGATIVSPTPAVPTSLSSRTQQQLDSTNFQLLSPVSPSAQPPPPSSSTQPSSSATPALISPENDLLPLKSFVHEVLKRSRTSGSVLQTALCYLEAVRPKISEILHDEKMGIRAYYQPESRILLATEAELEQEADFFAMEATTDDQLTGDSMKTIRVSDHYPEDDIVQQQTDCLSVSSSLIAQPSLLNGLSTASLPSPLLCPRRAFLASLILASKFSQDKCYSNRAWAKLSGLPPREIGRCERALGQALEWRLWVGKSPAESQSPMPVAPPVRTIVRSQSESSISLPSSTRVPFMAPRESFTLTHPHVPLDVLPSASSLNKGLRRCSTLPAESFASRLRVPSSSVIKDVSCDSTFPMCPIGPEQEMEIVDVYCVNDRKQEPELPTTFVQSTGSYTISQKDSATPSPDTPSLSYSPSSTDSSGDRTIQMTSFEDNVFPSFNGSQSWLDVSDPRCGAVGTTSPVPFSGNFKENVYLASGLALDLVAHMHGNANTIAVADSDAGPVGPNMGHYLWHADGGRISLESTGVH